MMGVIMIENFRSLRSTMLAMCVLGVVSVLYPQPAMSKAVKPSALESSLPQGVKLALTYFSFYSDNRHVQMILDCFATEHRGTGALVRAPELKRQLGLKRERPRAKPKNARSYYLASRGLYYSISRDVVDQLVSRFIRYMIAHPKFDGLFEKYIENLNFAERVAIRLLLVSNTKADLFQSEGRKFILNTFKDNSKQTFERMGN